VSRIAGNPNGHSALALARDVGKDKALNPEPRLDEQLEAAVGLCRLPADPAKELQVGYVSYLVGQFTYDFAKAFQDSRAQAAVREPWKVHASRLLEAMTEMEAAHERDPSVMTMTGIARGVLKDVEHPAAALNPATIGKWAEKNQTGQDAVYKSDPKSSVVPRNGGDKGM
jgi:hypothetical protein